MSRHGEFVAANLRPPTPEEAQVIAEQESQDRRDAEAKRHEAEIKRIFMAQPGADEAGWQRDRAEVMAESRKADTLRQREEARRSQAALYRSF